MDLRVGGKFKLIKKCGSGAFGEIYQGKLTRLIQINHKSVLGIHITFEKLFLTIFVFMLQVQTLKLAMMWPSNL